jgi:hypothetical protein
MATRNFAEMANLVDTKVSEMEEMLDALLKSDVAESTKRTQKFQRTTAIRTLLVFLKVLKSSPDALVTLNDEEEKWFTSMVTLTSVRKAKNVVIFKDGDSIIEIMDEHPNINYKKLKEQLEEQGFHLEGHTVRA